MLYKRNNFFGDNFIKTRGFNCINGIQEDDEVIIGNQKKNTKQSGINV
jgi:hypothetical protein